MKKEKKDPTTSNTEKSQVSRRNFVKGAATLPSGSGNSPSQTSPGRSGIERRRFNNSLSIQHAYERQLPVSQTRGPGE
jgi:hypothetical protein